MVGRVGAIAINDWSALPGCAWLMLCRGFCAADAEEVGGEIQIHFIAIVPFPMDNVVAIFHGDLFVAPVDVDCG